MKFFVDTADVGEIRDLAACGLVDGVITNSSPFDVNREICAIVPRLVSAETVATDHNGLRAFLDDWARTGQSIL